MVRTRVGYAGGSKPGPTYRDMGDHTETVQVEYDPDRVAYRELLDVFWRSHDPTQRSWNRQYASLAFYHDEGQRRLIEESKAREEARLGRTIRTEVVPYHGFTRAENYHQKHALQLFPEFLDDLRSAYSSFRDLVDSTAAARLNGYLGGDGLCEGLKEDLPRLGLSDVRQTALQDLVCRHRRGQACPLPGRMP